MSQEVTTCLLCGTPVVPAKTINGVEWVQCLNPACPIPDNKQRRWHDPRPPIAKPRPRPVPPRRPVPVTYSLGEYHRNPQHPPAAAKQAVIAYVAAHPGCTAGEYYHACGVPYRHGAKYKSVERLAWQWCDTHGLLVRGPKRRSNIPLPKNGGKDAFTYTVAPGAEAWLP